MFNSTDGATTGWLVSGGSTISASAETVDGVPVSLLTGGEAWRGGTEAAIGHNVSGVFSVFVKAGSSPRIRLSRGSAQGGGYIEFSPHTGEVFANTASASLIPVSGGYRIVCPVHYAGSGDGNMYLSNRTSTGAAATEMTSYLGGVQAERGTAATPYQRVVTAAEVYEAGVPGVWHLYNDGGDSLPAILPAGAWEIAWVTHLGAIGYASVTSDGTTGIDLLRAERMADVAVKRGRFTSYEKAQLETQWGKYKP